MIKLILNNSFLASVIASIDSSPAATVALPCANLVNGMRHKLCRIISSTPVITIVLESAISISSVGIGGLTLGASATAQCVIKNASNNTVYDSSSGNVYSNSSQAQMPWFSRTKFWFTPSPVSAKTIVISLIDSASSVDISHLVFGTDMAPSINPDWGASWNWIDTSIQQRTSGGSLIANPTYGHRKMQMTWPLLPDTDWQNISTLLQSQGQSLMVSVMLGENSRREADMQMIGRLVSADGINLTSYDVNSLASVIIEEI
jgi:hypothetical protein